MKYTDTMRKTFEIYRGLFQNMGGRNPAYWLSQGLAISMDIAYSVVIAKTFQNVIDQVAAHGSIDYRVMITYLLTVVLVVLVWGFGDSYVSARVQDQLQCRYRSVILSKLLSTEVFDGQQLDLGDVGKRYSTDVKNAVQFLVRRISSSIISPLVGGVGCLILLVEIHPLIALLVLSIGIFVFYLQKMPVPKTDEYAEAQLHAESNYSTDMYDVMNNLPVIRMFGAAEFLRKRIGKDADNIYTAGIHTLKLELYQKLLLVVGQFLQILVLVIVGAFFIGKELVTLGELFAAVTYAEGVCFMFDGVSRGLANVQGGKAAGIRILEILNLCAEKRNTDVDVSAENAVEVRNLCCSAKEKDILKDISFSVKVGEKVAIMGTSGSGKTTLARIISGILHSYEGEVRLNSQKICYVPAVGHLLQGSLLENITCFEQKPEKERVRRIVTTLGLNVDRLEEYIEEHGNRVSGGERQRILIARALYRESDIYIFDEPTAALDAKSALNVMEAILQLLEGKTILLITHDKKIAGRFDKIYELKEGKITGNWVS